MSLLSGCCNHTYSGPLSLEADDMVQACRGGMFAMATGAWSDSYGFVSMIGIHSAGHVILPSSEVLPAGIFLPSDGLIKGFHP